MELFDLLQQGIIRCCILQNFNHHLLGWQALCQAIQQQGVGEIDEAGAATQ